MTPDYITFSNIIIDDIVLSDGRTFMGTLGGAGTHALIGMRIWSDRLGYVATVGSDFAPEHRAQVEKLGVDMRGVVHRNGYQTARAWQLFEPDDRRIEVFRTDLADFHEFTPQFTDIPPDYRTVAGVHFDWGETVPMLTDLVRQFRAAKPHVVLVVEPTPEQLRTGTAEEMRTLFKYIDLFSPNGEDAKTLTGIEDPQDSIERMLEWGAPLVALRLGADGSIVHTADGGNWKLPAVPPRKIVDVTGAGNAYCGGFVVGLGDGLEPVEASLRAAVSASFSLEQFGVPDIDEKTMEEAERRLRWVRDRVEIL